MRLSASSVRAVLPGVLALGVFATSSDALGGNSQHPRTPVEWDDVTCMEFVDRSVEPNYTFVYGIPLEDTDLTPEEVENSRTHQFFALCRQSSPRESLPTWITTADVEQALLAYEEFATPPDGDIFELATEWDGCWYRINADAERRPITDVAASQPVTWDTSAVPVGVYTLAGYTYEPVFNVWAPRVGGVVRVHDGGDPAANGPAAAITTNEQTPCVGDSILLEGCVDALPGTTMTASFAVDSDTTEPTWVPFAQDVPIDGEAFSVNWVTPQETSGESVLLRVDFIDPNGASYTAYQYEPNIVLPAESAGCAPGPSGCEGGFVMDPACETTGAGSTSDSGETDRGIGTAGGAEDGPTDEGCGCRSPETLPGSGGVLGLLGLLALRRRRSPIQCSRASVRGHAPRGERVVNRATL
ncbi:MAG: MYXO-CTERM sorting domain-containing protein [Nannocystales bacterium]